MGPGQLGENVTTRGIDLLGLGRGTRLRVVCEEGTGWEGVRGAMEGFVRVTFLAVVVVVGVNFGAEGWYVLFALGVHVMAILLRMWVSYKVELENRYREELGKNVAIVEVTGLRQPCKKVDQFRPGLKEKVGFKDQKGNKVVKAGIMGIVLAGGVVRPGMRILVEEAEVWEPLPLLL